MRRFTMVAVLLLIVVMVVGSQEPSKKLPNGFSKLGLSAKQKDDVYAVQAKYRKDIMKLEMQITDLKTMERADMLKLLTEEQKTLLRKLLLGDEGK